MTPWQAAIEAIGARLRLRRCTHVGRGVRVLGRVWVHGSGEVHVGDGVVLDAREAPIELRAAQHGRLALGSDVLIEGGASIEATTQMTIGPRCRIGPYAKIIDNHFHPLTGNRHERPAATPVELGADVHVGAGAIILPGALLGDGVHVGPRAVVSRRVPPNSDVTGNPARVVPRAPA